MTLTQQGWLIIPPIIIATCINYTIHKATTKNLLDLEHLTPKSINVWKHSHKSLFHTSRTSPSTNGNLKRKKPQSRTHTTKPHNLNVTYETSLFSTGPPTNLGTKPPPPKVHADMYRTLLESLFIPTMVSMTHCPKQLIKRLWRLFKSPWVTWLTCKSLFSHLND